jgi:hypothetical protein
MPVETRKKLFVSKAIYQPNRERRDVPPSLSNRHKARTRAAIASSESIAGLGYLISHDPRIMSGACFFGKPISTFPDHALGAKRRCTNAFIDGAWRGNIEYRIGSISRPCARLDG